MSKNISNNRYIICFALMYEPKTEFGDLTFKALSCKHKTDVNGVLNLHYKCMKIRQVKRYLNKVRRCTIRKNKNRCLL